MRQQVAAAGRNAEVSASTNGAAAVLEETEVSRCNGSADQAQNIGEDTDGKSGIDADTPTANVATAAAETLENDDNALRIERMRLKKQQRKAAREAKRKKAQAAVG